MANVLDTIKSNIGIISAGAGGLAIGSAVGYVAGRSSRKKSKSRKRSKSKTRKKSSHNRKKSKRYTPHTAGKRKDRSTKRIRMTKNGQPYVLMASGKARFIKKSSARLSRKRKGGRY
jgi:hypothetical protein